MASTFNLGRWSADVLFGYEVTVERRAVLFSLYPMIPRAERALDYGAILRAEADAFAADILAFVPGTRYDYCDEWGTLQAWGAIETRRQTFPALLHDHLRRRGYAPFDESLVERILEGKELNTR